MKKLSKYALSAVAVAAVAAFAQNALAANVSTEPALCELLRQFKGVIGTIRTLAFVGAAFMIMEWAWGYISKPGDLKKEDIKDKGLALLVGFALLLGVGFVLNFIGSASGQTTLGCITDVFK